MTPRTTCAWRGTAKCSRTRTRATITATSERSRYASARVSWSRASAETRWASPSSSTAAAAEITEVFVHPAHRGGGLGTALTQAAIEAAGPVRDLWIGADAPRRPKELYERLGFRPAWTAMEFTRHPRDGRCGAAPPRPRHRRD